MCDYSLHQIPNRLAVDGERLVTYRFPTGCMGLASMPEFEEAFRRKEGPESGWEGSWLRRLADWVSGGKQPKIQAVCVPPGTHLLVGALPKRFQRRSFISSGEEASFVQLTCEAYQYRDAVSFRNGRTVLLQKFPEGVQFLVLSTDPVAGSEASQEFQVTVRPSR
jgi:hypothetical protein